MVKNLSYRDKLLELASIYKVSDIQDYIKRKKHLTTSQIVHILKKNNVPLPVEVYTTYFDRNISKPLTKLESKARHFLLDFVVFSLCLGHFPNMDPSDPQKVKKNMFSE